MRPSLSKREETTLYWIGLVILVLTLTAAIIVKITGFSLPEFFPGCVFLRLTGLYCPGCGGTRAVAYLFGGHPINSFFSHPLVPYTAVFGGWYLASHTVERLSKGRFGIGMRYRDVYVYAAVVIVVINCIVKNIFLLQGVYLLG